MAIEFINPVWDAPPNVRALTSTRDGGVSMAPYNSLNVADHVDDDPDSIAINRDRLAASARLPSDPVWLKQVHGKTIIDAAVATPATEADGSVSSVPDIVCAVLTADCLPVFLCDQAGGQAAVLHAGWRGLSAGIIEQGVRAMSAPAPELLAWLGPAIGPDVFEVGTDVRQVFIRHDPQAQTAFKASGHNKWLADIYLLARMRLQALGLKQITGGDYCTYSDEDRFFSFRRDGKCGRMASLIWLDGKS